VSLWLESPAPASTCRFPAASPDPTETSHLRGLELRGIIKGSLAFTRPVFPCLRPPDGTGAAWAFSLSFEPHRYQRRTSGREQAIGHGPGAKPSTSLSTSQSCSLTRATSCRTNYFKYARAHFALDALDSYADTGDDPTRLVPNLAKANALAQVTRARADLAAAQTDMSQAIEEATVRARQRGNHGKATVSPAAAQAITAAEDRLAAAQAASRATASHLPLA